MTPVRVGVFVGRKFFCSFCCLPIDVVVTYVLLLFVAVGYMPCWSSWLSRHPLKVETTGSSPVHGTKRADYQWLSIIW